MVLYREGGGGCLPRISWVHPGELGANIVRGWPAFAIGGHPRVGETNIYRESMSVYCNAVALLHYGIHIVCWPCQVSFDVH